jgi:bacterial/archaeal transporter family-2 protein
MSQLVPVLLLVVCGSLIAVQATINAALGRNLGMALFAVVFSAIQTACALPLLLGWPPRMGGFAVASWWQYLGAAMGVVLLIGIASGIARTGTFVAMMALLVGQLAAGILIDHHGLFGRDVNPITWSRAAGLLMAVAGIYLAR